MSDDESSSPAESSSGEEEVQQMSQPPAKKMRATKTEMQPEHPHPNDACLLFRGVNIPEDCLLLILGEFLNWKSLARWECTNKSAPDYAKFVWKMHAKSLSLCGVSSKKDVIIYFQSKDFAEKMENLQDTHCPEGDLVEELGLTQCQNCSQMPSRLAQDVLNDPSKYRFFVRISDRDKHSGNRRLLWDGHLAFYRDKAKTMYDGSRRSITSDIEQSVGKELFQNWDSLKSSINLGYSYLNRSFNRDNTYVKDTASVTVVATPKPDALIPPNQVFVPRLVVTVLGHSAIGFTMKDDQMWCSSFMSSHQHIETHDYLDTYRPKTMTVSLELGIDRIMKLSVKYHARRRILSRREIEALYTGVQE